jgi:hypothetical protein
LDYGERITPEKVKEAYRVTGLKPAQGKFFPEPGCACALGALYAQANGVPKVIPDEEEVVHFIRDFQPKHYQIGFAHGFDGHDNKYGNTYVGDHREVYLDGYNDGRAAFKAVSGEEE